MYFGGGTFAEQATMTAGTIARKPTSIGHRTAAALPLAAATASALLDALPPGKGSTLLVIGASGGVGSTLVQLAAARGVRVIGVCSG
jgi:NADPH2:quinone reductase